MRDPINSALHDLITACTTIDQRQIHRRYRENFVQALERAKRISGWSEPVEVKEELRADEFSSSAGYGGWGHDE